MKTRTATRRSRKAAAEIAADDNDTVALALTDDAARIDELAKWTPAGENKPAGKARARKEAEKARRGRKAKAADEFVLLDPADLNDRLAAYLYEGGAKRMDVARLERWAKANDLWQPAYDALDGGRKRMCCGIRARKKLAAGLPLVFPA
jgi:hypothetical protein